MIIAESLAEISSEQLYKSFFELSIDGILIIDPDGFINAVNTAMTELTGYNSNELLGFSINDFISDEEYENWQLFLNTLLLEGSFNNFQGCIKRKDGLGVYVEINSKAIKNQTNNYLGSFNNIRDISKRKTFEDELIIAKQKAETSDRLKTAFLSNMSHEIRTPMNAILGFSELLKYRELDLKDQEYYLDTILKKGNHLVQLINDIIDISKIETGDLQYQIEPTNVLDFIIECCTTLNDDFILRPNSLVKFQKSVPAILPDLQMLADPYRLNQVILNLFQNAKKFTTHGFIEFGAYLSANNEVVFYLKDTGIGIATKDQKMVFERFKQTDSESYKKTDGTGLGLAISKHIVQLMNGKIWLESEIGQGSCFFFSIPLK